MAQGHDRYKSLQIERKWRQLLRICKTLSSTATQHVGNSTISAEAVRNLGQTSHGSDFVTVDVCAESAVSRALKVNFLQRLVIRSGG
jgi:hypothetical protein